MALRNTQTLPENLLDHMGTGARENPIKVRYTNYKGQTAIRTIIPIRFLFGSTEYHAHEQWLIEVWDMQKNALRTYALKDISQWFIE